MDLNQWVFIGLFFALGWTLPALPIVLGKLLAPRRPNPVKLQAYECGVEMVGSAWTQFRAQYYIFALVFVIFDVELVFLFPWALAYNQLGLFALFAGRRARLYLAQRCAALGMNRSRYARERTVFLPGQRSWLRQVWGESRRRQRL